MNLKVIWERLSPPKLGIKYTLPEKILYWFGVALMTFGGILMLRNLGDSQIGFAGAGASFFGLLICFETMLSTYSRRIKELLAV